MPPNIICRDNHARFRFILSDTTRRCVCVACGHKWSVHLGSGKRRGDNETDSIPNHLDGSQFAAMQAGRL